MNRLYKLRSYGYVEIDDDIWFPNQFFNALIKLNKSSGRIQIVNKFPGYSVKREWLYSTVCCAEGMLVFVPNGSQEIASYDIKSGLFKRAALDQKLIKETGGHFLEAYVHESYVYMMPAMARYIIKYNAKENSIKYLGFCLEKIMSDLPKDSFCFGIQFEIVDEKIYMPFVELNAVAIFDIKNESLDIKYLNITGGCSTINYINGLFYLASSKYPKLYSWNADTEEIKVYDEFPKKFETGDSIALFHCAFDVKEKLFFFPILSNMVVSLDTTTGKVKEELLVEIPEEESLITYFARKEDNKNYILMANIEEISFLKSDDEEKIQIKPYFKQDGLYNKKQISNFILKHMYQDEYIEGNEKELKEYIEIFIYGNKMVKKKEINNFGELIFNELR